MDKLIYWVWLAEINKFGPINQRKLLHEFQSPEKIYKASKDELLQVKGIGDALADGIIKNKSLVNAEYILKEAKKKNIEILTIEDELYPKEISKINKMPVVLYYKGTLRKNDKRIGIMGSRRCTDYAKEVTKEVSSYLAKNDVTIISGMAKGIDSYAHMACIDAKGYTIAVLSSGVDICYPKEHMNLYKKIIETGAVVSEYPPGTKIFYKNFLKKNFLIAALSETLIIPEADKTSGFLAAIKDAMKQGKKTFAVPNRINVTESEGTNELILEGATILINKEQLVDNQSSIKSIENGKIRDIATIL
ncbi:MAG: DNA-processing protein DprA [Clostridiales bacterium]|nr:DNA-processing protein DprA [Clostridiales bacterium]